MAAPPSKPNSPASQPLQQQESEEGLPSSTATTTTASASPAVAAAPPKQHQLKKPPSTISEPTYEHTYWTSKASDHYTVAKTLLTEGEFENALTTIEEGIALLRETLMQTGSNSTRTGNLPEDEIALHPALAPLHYLYGTTLLYSLEESPDQQNAMQLPGAGGGDAPSEHDQDEMQIAFENLDTARLIMEKMMTAAPSTYNPPREQDQAVQLSLDLAQIFLREGDLGRINGHYQQALGDYQRCLELRQKHLGPWDRQIADVHYQLALVYSLAVVDNNNNGDNDTADTSTPANDITVEQKERYRQESARHFVACARALCGQVATRCRHSNPEQLVEDALSVPLPGKTTGEEDDDTSNTKLIQSRHQIKSLRTAVEALEIPVDEELVVRDLLDLLQEIQETVDHTQESEKGVQQVTDMKAAIAAAVAAQPDSSSTTEQQASSSFVEAEGGTTTIGFGAAAAATANQNDEQPVTMMVARKKKKRKIEDAKPAAAE